MAQQLRIATWNICWFANLFDQNDRLDADDSASPLSGVTKAEQAVGIAQVLKAVDADAWAIIEAPNTGSQQNCVRALEHFAAAHELRTTKALTGFASHTEQEIALLFDPSKINAAHDPKTSEDAPRFDGEYLLDLDGDGEIDHHRFSKPPLEAEVEILGSGERLRLIAVHAKSKAPHGAKTPQDATRISLLNRRKQLAQCAWLRARIEHHLTKGEAVIALGDFNDGPGLDKYERAFGRSGVEVVMGDPGDPSKLLRNPYTRRRMTPFGPRPSTARFLNRQSGTYLNALIDFIMLSPDLAIKSHPVWRIWHPFDDEECFGDKQLQSALLNASDHFPVTVDLSI